MLSVIVGEHIDDRKKKRAALLGEQDVITLDDATSTFELLESYVYPSLFSQTTPVVHAKYLLETVSPDVYTTLIPKLVQSPTVFVLEEYSIGAPLKKMLEKGGATIHHNTQAARSKKPDTIFSVTRAITAQTKKERWLAYHEALATHAPEAILGILYWKLRQLIEASPKQKITYAPMYSALIHAQKDAWQHGYPLSLAIEKVILVS